MKLWRADWFADWIEAERGRFILLLPVAMGGAILTYFDLPAEPPLWLGGALCTMSLAALAVAWRLPPWQLLAALCLAASLGFGRAEWRTAEAPPLLDVPYGAVTVAGRIAVIDILPLGRRVSLTNPELDNAPPASRMIRLRLRNDDTTPLNVGETISLKSMLFRTERPAYPGAWDFGRDAFFNGLGASGFALTDVTVTAPASSGAVAEKLQELRREIAARILAVLPVSTGSVAVTLFTGFQAAMPAAERQDFITAGLAHILAVAGLHVGIVMGLCFTASRFVLTRHEHVALHLPSKAVAALIALAAGGVYAALTGAHLPILRSLAMAALVTLGVLAGRRAVSLRGLALAAMIIMLCMPQAIIGVSFQMSFSAVLALISGYAAAQAGFARLHRAHTPAGRLGAHIAGLAYTSLLAGGASMPFAAYQFQQIQPYWILANLIAVPLTALWIMPLGLLGLALMPVGLSALALVPMGWGIAAMVWLTQVISAWPAALLDIPPVPPLAILLFAAGLAWLGLWRSKARRAGIGFMLAALLVYGLARPPDVLVSADARLIALHAGPQILLLRQPQASAYTLKQWQPVWNPAAFTKLDAGGLPAAVTINGAQILLTAAAPEHGCGAVLLVVAAEPLHGACKASGRVVIDRFSVWRDGAIAIWVGPHGVRLLSDKQVQGSRPWVPDWPVWQNYGAIH